MLRELLAALKGSPATTGVEIRQRLNLSREAYEHLLAHLIRLGYVASVTLEAGEAACSSGGCKGCPVGCQSSPTLGPQTLTITEKGSRFLAKAAS